MKTPTFPTRPILTVGSERSVRSTLNHIRTTTPEWVVVVKGQGLTDRLCYAFQPAEFEDFTQRGNIALDAPIDQAFGLKKFRTSVLRGSGFGYSLPEPDDEEDDLFSSRIVELDYGGNIERVFKSNQALIEALRARRGFPTGPMGPIDPGDAPINIGPPRGTDGGLVTAREDEPEPGTAEIDVMLSAETKSEIDIGSETDVRVRVELADGATPLAVAEAAIIDRFEKIKVSLSANNAQAIAIVGDTHLTLDPPDIDKPRTSAFRIKGLSPGVSPIAVHFRQGGSLIGVAALAVQVLAPQAEAPALTKVTHKAAPRDHADDEVLHLMIEQRKDEDGAAYFFYTLYSEPLEFANQEAKSRPLKRHAQGVDAAKIAYVKSIYARVAEKLQTQNDLKALQRDMQAVGVSLSDELFDPELVAALWPKRDKIKSIQIFSWEPYIPWEMVRLRDPKSREIDTRFLAEYGLVRSFQDHFLPRNLKKNDIRYLQGDYSGGALKQVGSEVDYFTKTGPQTLSAHGKSAARIEANADAFFDVLKAGDFDVLHLACHGETEHDRIEAARLVLAQAPNAPLVAVDATNVNSEAELRARRPLVFLNACETARGGVVLTSWGGWARIFIDAGAGAFVGAAWPVYEKPAAAFAQAFYDALLGGASLAEAANKARAAAKTFGDASWLAYKIYGHPRAVMS